MPYPLSGVGSPTFGQQAPTGGISGGGTGSKWGWLVPVVGAVVSAIFDKSQNDATNKANAQNVQAQIDFQREQNATAYQRAVKDMAAAGLNPSLAYKQGGADSGSGAAAENRAFSASERLAQAVNSYQQFANGTAQRELLRQQAAATDAQRLKTLAEANTLQPAAALAANTEYRKQYADTEFKQLAAKRFTADNTPRLFEANLGATMQTTATARQQEQLLRSQTTLNEQEFMNVWFRKNIAPYLNSTAKTLEGVGAVTRTGKGLTGYTPTRRYY